MQESPLILWASPEKDSDILYFGQFSAPDEILLAEYQDKKFAVINALEFGRAKQCEEFDEVLSWEHYQKRAQSNGASAPVGVKFIILELLKEWNCKQIRVAENFPIKLAFELQEHDVELVVQDSPLFPQRELKNSQELEKIRYGNQCSAKGFSVVQEILGASSIDNDGQLIFEGKVLTSELLHFEIAKACLSMGAISKNTIAAGGNQACDPHHHGSGPLKANELIIIDIFPRVESSGYHGDMTRTYLKGRPNKEQIDLVSAVKKAHEVGLNKICAGITGDEIHRSVQNVFDELGYKTERDENGYKGFFHGTGHGLGLDVHESPRVSLKAPALKEGHVVTVEPGLYYSGIGGVRIEDVVVVKDSGYDLLSDYPYDWIID